MITELQKQYHATLDMFELAVNNCPDALWGRVFGDNSPFWKEAYHCVFWLHNFLGGPTKRFELKPFGVDIDPRLFKPCSTACSKDEMQKFIASTRTHIDGVFETLTLQDLDLPDGFRDDGGFRSVAHRLLYGLRHGQHHAGKLTAYLFATGIDYDPWRG